MKNINTQTEVYISGRPLKQHENEMLDIVNERFLDKRFSMLDIGCADGLFCKEVKERMSSAVVTGLDFSEKLISKAKSLNLLDATFISGDALTFETEQKYDLLIGSGILSIFENFDYVLQKWLRWLKPDGIMFIFGRFNSADIDTQISFRNNFNQSDWESGLTTYSMHTVGRFLQKVGYNYEFKRFHLEIDLPKNENPVRTYTVNTSVGEKLVLNGANLVAEQYFLKIWKQNRKQVEQE